MASSDLRTIVPLVPTGGTLNEALDFYITHLGFEVVRRGGNMAGVRRGIQFNLIENNVREWADNMSMSIGVDDLDALYEEYRSVPARVGPLEVKSWGRREFRMIVPSGVCLQFHQHEG